MIGVEASLVDLGKKWRILGKKRIVPDGRDLRIVMTLDKARSRISTQEIGRALNIPSRTVRFRLKRLTERGYLEPPFVLTHERRLGLGENLLVVQEAPMAQRLLTKIVEQIPIFYSYATTYGKFNGYLLRSVFSLFTPDPSLELLKMLQKKGIIHDFRRFEVVDSHLKEMDLSFYHPDKGWVWNWKKWVDGIEGILRSSKKSGFMIEQKYGEADFDFKDVQIVKRMVENAGITAEKLGKILGMSQTQVGKRIQKLEKARIIKGYKSVFNPKPAEELVSFFFFIEARELADQILFCLCELPFAVEFLIESENRFCFRSRLSPVDFNGFLLGVDRLRPHLDSFFLQLAQGQQFNRAVEVYDLFREESRCWETPSNEYVARLESLLEENERTQP